MRIFNEKGEKLYQDWVLKFCAKATKGQGEVPYHLLESKETSVSLFVSRPQSNYTGKFTGKSVCRCKVCSEND